MKQKPPRLRGSHAIHGLAAQVLLSLLQAAYAQDCTLNLSEPLLDFGDLNRAELQSQVPGGTPMSAGARSTLLTIRCERPADIVLRIDGQPAGPRHFAWTEHGSYTVTMRNPRLDGRPVLLARIGESGDVAHPASPDATFVPGEAIAAIAGGRVAAANVFTAQIDVEAHVAPAALRTRDDTELSASAQLRRIE
ncbi:hypothetical protein KDW36_08195 [Burkholderia dolosa]|uniref:hypothetical protein n=1 Tax=Burkholderia dolosa TaxID=152500 RepID=UPI001BA3A46C|nr:hypothetical protein [Burkholderia dolosa]MBR8313179.1 hypothetical protein [Burkholderia dolosa]